MYNERKLCLCGGKSEHSIMIDDNYYLMASIEKEKTGKWPNVNSTETSKDSYFFTRFCFICCERGMLPAHFFSTRRYSSAFFLSILSF